jgi:hypothetical protein
VRWQVPKMTPFFAYLYKYLLVYYHHHHHHHHHRHHHHYYLYEALVKISVNLVKISQLIQKLLGEVVYYNSD